MTKEIKKTKSIRHYVDNEKLYVDMVKYLDLLKEAKANKTELPRIPNSVGVAISLIANNLSNSGNFVSYSYKDEMIEDGIENCIKYLHNFDPVKFKSPFNYFTTIIYYAFLRRIKREKKEQYLKYKLTINSMITNTLVESSEDAAHFQAMGVEINFDPNKMAELVKLFETSDEEKKKKKAEKAGVTKFIGDDDES